MATLKRAFDAAQDFRDARPDGDALIDVDR
jgi:hypothetical protein